MWLSEQAAVAMWQPDYEELKENFADFFLSCDKKKKVETPDETYVVLYWDYIDSAHHDLQLLKACLKKRRHAILEIREDGEIIGDTETDDWRGCDGEFDEILGWSAKIDIWGDQIN